MTTTTKKNNSNNSKRNATAKSISLFESMTPTETPTETETETETETPTETPTETETETPTETPTETETETETETPTETPTETDLERRLKLSLAAVSIDDIFQSDEMRFGLVDTLSTLRDHADCVELRPLMERVASILKGIHTAAKARIITALCDGDTGKHVVLPRDSVVEMIDDLFTGLDVADVLHLASYCVPICDMIETVLDGAPMVTVIPSVLYKAGYTNEPLWDRLPRILNAVIPFKQNGDWTCASKDYVRNSVQTWGITQGCFIETDKGLFLIHSGLDKAMSLPTKEKRDARGTTTIVPKHAFQWVSKASRIIMYGRETAQDLDALKTVCLAYGCSDADWTAALDACKPKASKPKGSTSSKGKGTGKAKQSTLFDDIFGGLF